MMHETLANLFTAFVVLAPMALAFLFLPKG